MRPIVVHTLADLADAVAALPARGPLPARTVLVPSERHAHALRRALARSGRPAALAGTRLTGPLAAALEVLRTAGFPCVPGEEALRPARLQALFRQGLALEHFPAALLAGARGWDDAFAAAIGELEAAGLGPEDLPAESAQARDLRLLWSRVDAEAGSSFTGARIQLEAARLLAADPRAWPLDGPALALATGHEPAALARFLRAVPELTLALRAARPLLERMLARAEALYGAEARAVLERSLREGGAPPPREGCTERDLLAAYLFADADVLADPARPRSAGPDGTVSLEEHAGVDAELEATALWVSRQVLELGRPLESIAVLVPAQDPLALLVAERLERLPAGNGPLPVHVAGGVPAVGTAAGARLVPVLPALRVEGDAERRHLTHGEALEVAYGLGTIGGNAGWPAGALEWSARLAARIPELEGALARPRTDGDSSDRERWRLERMLHTLRAVRPALDALVGVARLLVDARGLASIWAALSAFLDRWLLAPGTGGSLSPRLAEALAPACAGGLGAGLTGADALALVERHLLALRVPRGRFGEAAVHVGTVASAAGLDLDAVRVVGLCEGVLPAAPREDPVLSEGLREALRRADPGRVIDGPEDRVLAQLHALVAVVAGARAAVALSAPRVDLARTEREPGSLFVDAAVALARPGPAGKPAEAVPDGAALRRDAFLPAAAALAAFRDAHPVSEAAWLDRVARTRADLPPGWTDSPALALPRIEALRAPAGRLGPGDGVLGPGEPFPPVPGLTPERPISASALQQLVQCPRMFLLRRILHWDEPPAAPSLRELDPLSFGSLFHRIVELFYREHGARFTAGEGTREGWLERIRALADAQLDAFLHEYPLVGEGVRRKERERLHDALGAFLEYDWAGRRGRRFVGVELPFGVPTPLALEAGGETLHVRGYIDRVDVEGEATVVRDLKSGRPYPRAGAEADPTPFRDVQLGLYQLVAKRLAPTWGTPSRVEAAYAYASGRADVEERAFRGDARTLERATGGWLATAAQLLAARAFPPTPDETDCDYCPFRPLCGDEAVARARDALAEEDDGPLARFRELKAGEEAEG